MILPNYITPSNSLYVIGGYVLSVLREKGQISIVQLYECMRAKRKDLSFELLALAIDWLYLAGYVKVQNGNVELCM